MTQQNGNNSSSSNNGTATVNGQNHPTPTAYDPYRYLIGESVDVPGTQAQLFTHREGADGNAFIRLQDIGEMRRGLFHRPLTSIGHLLRGIFCGSLTLFVARLYSFTIPWGVFGSFLTVAALLPTSVILLTFAFRAVMVWQKGGWDFNGTCTVTGILGFALGFLL